MVINSNTNPPTSQSDKFKEVAREIGADEGEARWAERLRKVAEVKPQPEKPE